MIVSSALKAAVVAVIAALALTDGANAALPDHAIIPERSPSPDLVLDGRIGPADLSTCRALPFQVPAGVVRLSAELSYTGRDQYTVLDMGVSDQDGSRGWSGSNKASFTLSRTDATPSYLPGAIRPGVWTISLCTSAIRPGRSDQYVVGLWFWRRGDTPAVSTFSSAPLKTGARWYRGDLHLHTAHSDGACTPASGQGKAPCPLYRTVQAAATRGLDFIAISDHNTGAQYNDMRELQPAFDTLLLIPAVEITTVHGHANMFGTTEGVDWRLSKTRSANDILNDAASLHALISLNHPASPTDETCRGCGWDAPGTDYSKVQAIEALNAGEILIPPKPGAPPLPTGEDFWRRLLDRGNRLTGVGGSDNHAVELGKLGVGLPTTVVYAPELSERAVLSAIRAGHVFIDALGSKDRLLELTGEVGSARAIMGDRLTLAAGAIAHFNVHMAHVSGNRLLIEQDGKPLALADPVIAGEDAARSFTVSGDGRAHWVRADVVSDKGPILIGNPIYLTPPASR